MEIAAEDFRSIRRTIDLIDAQMQDTGLGRIIRKFGDERPPAMIVGQFSSPRDHSYGNRCTPWRSG